MDYKYKKHIFIVLPFSKFIDNNEKHIFARHLSLIVNNKDPVLFIYFRVKDITNLRIVDASVMRNVPSGNTNAACMMIAEKAADMIKYTRNKKSEVGK